MLTYSLLYLVTNLRARPSCQVQRQQRSTTWVWFPRFPRQHGVNPEDKLKKFPRSPMSHACEFADLNKSSLVWPLKLGIEASFVFSRLMRRPSVHPTSDHSSSELDQDLVHKSQIYSIRSLMFFTALLKSQLFQNAYPPTHIALDFCNIYVQLLPPMDTSVKAHPPNRADLTL